MALDPMKLLPPRTIRWTRDEYYRMEASGLFVGRRVELIRGEVFESSPQSSLHASAITLMDSVFHQRIGPGFLVRVQLPLSLGQDSDPEPDIAIVKGDARSYVRAHPSTAGLVVEASESSLEHDRAIKTALLRDFLPGAASWGGNCQSLHAGGKRTWPGARTRMR